MRQCFAKIVLPLVLSRFFFSFFFLFLFLYPLDCSKLNTLDIKYSFIKKERKKKRRYQVLPYLQTRTNKAARTRNLCGVDLLRILFLVVLVGHVFHELNFNLPIKCFACYKSNNALLNRAQKLTYYQKLKGYYEIAMGSDSLILKLASTK